MLSGAKHLSSSAQGKLREESKFFLFNIKSRCFAEFTLSAERKGFFP